MKTSRLFQLLFKKFQAMLPTRVDWYIHKHTHRSCVNLRRNLCQLCPWRDRCLYEIIKTLRVGPQPPWTTLDHTCEFCVSHIHFKSVIFFQHNFTANKKKRMCYHHMKVANGFSTRNVRLPRYLKTTLYWYSALQSKIP